MDAAGKWLTIREAAWLPTHSTEFSLLAGPRWLDSLLLMRLCTLETVPGACDAGSAARTHRPGRAQCHRPSAAPGTAVLPAGRLLQRGCAWSMHVGWCDGEPTCTRVAGRGVQAFKQPTLRSPQRCDPSPHAPTKPMGTVTAGAPVWGATSGLLLPSYGSPPLSPTRRGGWFQVGYTTAARPSRSMLSMRLRME